MLITIGGTKVHASPAQADTIEQLAETRKGGMAVIHGYKPTTGVIDQPVFDVTFLSGISVARLYERRIKALRDVTFDEAAAHFDKFDKLAKLDYKKLATLFIERRNWMVERMEKSLAGVLDSAGAEAHKRNYVTIANGIKGHLVTEKDEDGIRRPVLDADGIPTLEHIMIEGIKINKRVRVEGSYKKVNSQAKTQMGQAIDKCLNRRSFDYRRYSLKDDNFERVTINREIINPAPELML